MKTAIDSYCYHRFFGEVYPGLETPPPTPMTLAQFVARARAHGVQGVAIEHFMLDSTTPDAIVDLRERLDDAELERVWAWGHPRGLGSGSSPEMLDDLLRHLEIAERVGARVMRICAGGRSTRTLPWPEHRDRLLPLLRRATERATAHGVTLAIENHIDLSTDEMLELVTGINHDSLGICLDTANNLRMFEDPMVAVERMAPHARAVHLKDIAAYQGSPRDFGFWPSVPLGRGLIDVQQVLRTLCAVGYDGLLALEIDYLHPKYENEEVAIVESLVNLRGFLGKLRDDE